MTPREFALEPGRGLGPVSLGMSREQVRAALASIGFALEHERDTLDYFCASSLQVEYQDGTVSFIGAASDPGFVVTFAGHDLFDTPAATTFALFAAGEAVPLPFKRGGGRFERQVLTLWEADRQYDTRGDQKRPMWGQIGIGDYRYLRAVQALGAD
jgi:hypothetical protein